MIRNKDSQAVQSPGACKVQHRMSDTSVPKPSMDSSTALNASCHHEQHPAVAADVTAATTACCAASPPEGLLDTAVDLQSSDISTEINTDPEGTAMASDEIEMLLSVSDTPSRRNTRGMSAAAALQATLLHSPMHAPEARQLQSPVQQQLLAQRIDSTTHLPNTKPGSASSSPPSPHLVALALLAASAKSYEEDMLLDMEEEEQEGGPYVGLEGGNRRKGGAEEHAHTPHPKRVRVRPGAVAEVVEKTMLPRSCKRFFEASQYHSRIWLWMQLRPQFLLLPSLFSNDLMMPATCKRSCLQPISLKLTPKTYI